MSADRDIPERTIYASEVAVVFCFDFSKFPEVLNGETLSAPTMTPVTNVTQGTPIVTVADFFEGSPASQRVVPSGQGAKVAVTCIAVGRYTLTCSVVMSGGTTRSKKLLLNVE